VQTGLMNAGASGRHCRSRSTGPWRPVANQGNDYLIDREAQHTVSYTGIAGVFPQDSAVTESMGDITDRSLEHLAPSDRMIVITRRRLADAARSLRDDDILPPLVDDPGIGTAIRSGDLIAPEDQPWLEAYEQTLRQALRPGVLLAAE
jgi:phthalate 4,5-dioxygenase